MLLGLTFTLGPLPPHSLFYSACLLYTQVDNSRPRCSEPRTPDCIINKIAGFVWFPLFARLCWTSLLCTLFPSNLFHCSECAVKRFSFGNYFHDLEPQVSKYKWSGSLNPKGVNFIGRFREDFRLRFSFCFVSVFQAVVIMLTITPSRHLNSIFWKKGSWLLWKHHTHHHVIIGLRDVTFLWRRGRLPLQSNIGAETHKKCQSKETKLAL